MATGSKAKKKVGRAKKNARRKGSAPKAGRAKSAPAQSGSDDAGASLRASAKSFAARMLR